MLRGLPARARETRFRACVGDSAAAARGSIRRNKTLRKLIAGARVTGIHLASQSLRPAAENGRKSATRDAKESCNAREFFPAANLPTPQAVSRELASRTAAS